MKTWTLNVCPECRYATAIVNAPVHEQGCSRPNCIPTVMITEAEHNAQVAHKDHRWDEMRHERDHLREQLMAYSETAAQRDALLTANAQLELSEDTLLNALEEVMAADKGLREDEWVEFANRMLPLMQSHGRFKGVLGYS